MKFAGVLRSARAFLLTFMIGLIILMLATLTVHYGLKAERATAENNLLREQARSLVTRLADVEKVLEAVGKERQEVEAVTLSTLAAVLDRASLDAEKQGQLYLASLTQEERKGAARMTELKGPPMSAASVEALAERTVEVKDRAKTLIREMQETTRLVQLRSDVLAAIPSLLPAKGWLSSDFGVRESPFHEGEKMHNGIDIAADEGTPVFAPADGVVETASLYGGYGKLVRISHGFGITTRFAHNSEILVKRGQKVKRGDQISVIGSTGRSTGPHVHYEVRVHGEPVDPARFVFDGDIATAPPQLLQASLRTEARPMGGETEFDADPREASVDGPVEKGLFPWTTGERIFLATMIPGPLGRTTTTDLIIVAIMVLLLAVCSSLVRFGDASPYPLAKVQVAAPRSSTYDLGAWSGRSSPDDSDDDT